MVEKVTNVGKLEKEVEKVAKHWKTC